MRFWTIQLAISKGKTLFQRSQIWSGLGNIPPLLSQLRCREGGVYSLGTQLIIDTFNNVRPLRFLRELRIWASSDLVLGFSMWTFFWEIFREVGIIDTFYGGEIIQPALSKKSYRLGLLNMAIATRDSAENPGGGPLFLSMW